jgi:ribokinase
VRVAVVGHVEVVEFARVASVPRPGDIVHVSEAWEEPAGGGGVAAVQLSRLAGVATLYTALGDDERGRRARTRLEELGVRVEAVFRPEPQRRAFTFLDDTGERTITVIGDRMTPNASDDLPFDELAAADALYFTGGAAAVVREARRARVLVATSRVLDTLREARVELDALVGSGRDPSERYEDGDLDPPPRLIVRTDGERGGTWQTADGRAGTFPPQPVPGPVVDAYGAGDSFAAGLTFALGLARPLDEALAFAARCGSEALTRRGAHGRSRPA